MSTPDMARQAALMAISARKKARDKPKNLGPVGLADFARTVMPDYEESRVTRLFCGELEALERGDIRKLMLLSPPREGKSTHTAMLFPAWMLGRNPKRQIISSSYNDEMAERNSRAVKDLVTSELWPYADCRVRKDVQSVSHWQTTAGGIFRAAGVGGGLTGYGADVLLIDDPVKNREEAMSQILRDRAWDWYSTVARTRVMSGGLQLLCMTRWHEDDLGGRILNSKGASEWRLVSLPMECEDPATDPLGRRLGEFLNGRMPKIEVPSVAKEEISPTDYAAMYQQRPAALEGNMFKRDWWRFYDRDLLFGEGLAPMFITVDTAFKENAENDYSVAACWGTFRGRAYLIDLWREKVAFAQLIQRLHAFYERWRVPLIIEDRASGQSAIQVLSADREPEAPRDEAATMDLMRQLRLAGPRIPIVAFKLPRFSTLVGRAQFAQPYVWAGHVYLPGDADCAGWVQTFVDEHSKFPSGAHDDQVATTAMALPKLFQHMESEQRGDTQSQWSTYTIRASNFGQTDRRIPQELFG